MARADERMRAVSTNGSRANPFVLKDKYQDYDITYFVSDVKSFLDDRSWLLQFGNPLIVQEPDLNDQLTGWFSSKPHDFSKSYGWLMLFDDGNRMDLGIISINELSLFHAEGEPTITLLDKDGLLPIYPNPNDSVYWVKKPDKDIYHACCNEFWWCLNNVAKGIARDELPYAMEMFNHYVRDMLHILVEWYIGVNTDFSVSAGKMGKYFKKYLSPELYDMYAKTYSDSDYAHLWTAVFTMCDLFHTLALSVASHFGFTYRYEEEDGISEYLRMVKEHVL